MQHIRSEDIILDTNNSFVARHEAKALLQSVSLGTQSKWVLQKAVMPLTSGCVGLCYHYQKKGDMTTYRKIMKVKGFNLGNVLVMPCIKDNY